MRHPGPREVVVYVDEVDIHLHPKVGPDWLLTGTQRLVVTPGKNQKHHLAGPTIPTGSSSSASMVTAKPPGCS